MRKRIAWIAAVLFLDAVGFGLTWRPTLDTSPSLHTTTLEGTVTFKAPIPDTLDVDLVVIDEGQWRAKVVTKGKNPLSFKLTPDRFKSVKEGKSKSPLDFAGVQSIEVKDPAAVKADIRWTGNDGIVLPWEKDPAPVEKSGGRTWWPGQNTNNAGHFGWKFEPNGLLINNVSFACIERSWYYFKPARYGESFQFNFRIPNAKPQELAVSKREQDNVKYNGLAWRLEYTVNQGVYARDKIQVDWTSVRRRREIPTPNGKSFYQELRYSAMGLGVQVETDSPDFEVSFQDAKTTRGPGGIVVPAKTGVKVLTSGQAVALGDMHRNWLLLVCNDGSPEIPVLLVFQHRPDRFEWKKESLVIHRDKGVGTLAMETPFGATVLDPRTLSQWKARPDAVPVERINHFVNLMTALPWKCHEEFAVDNEWVYIRDKIQFLPWQDDWGTRPEAYAPLPPLVSYSIAKGYLPTDCVKGTRDLDVYTKWGPYWAKQGDTIEYKLPIADPWDYMPLGVTVKPELKWLYDRMMNSFSKQAIRHDEGKVDSPVTFPHCVTLEGAGGPYRAANFLSPDLRRRMRTLAQGRYRAGLYPQNYRFRHDPVTGASYLACSSAWFNPPQPNDGTFDIDYWQGTALYGLYMQAKYGAEWDTLRKYWPTVRSIFTYWEALHSWIFMSPGAHESGEMYHGDNAAASWWGIYAAAQLAHHLGTDYQRDMTAYLLAKQSVPLAAKWGFRDWAVKFPHQESPWGQICSGFGERWVCSLNSITAAVKDYSAKDPWWLSGCIGPQSAVPEMIDILMKRCPKDMLKWEHTFLRVCPDAGFKTHDNIRVMPHIMLRTYLSDAMRENAVAFLKDWQSTYMLRDVHVIAALLAWDCPVRLIDWAPAYISSGQWDEKAKIATLGIDAGKTAARIRLAVKANGAEVLLNGQKVSASIMNRWKDWIVVAVDIPSGVHHVNVRPMIKQMTAK